MTRVEDLTEAELAAFISDHAGLANQGKQELRNRRLQKRENIAAFMKVHRDFFLLFFEVAGCKRPEEAVDSLIESPEEYRPMAYAQKDPV